MISPNFRPSTLRAGSDATDPQQQELDEIKPGRLTGENPLLTQSRPHKKHGTKTRRSWRKLHIGLDADTGQIVAAVLTTKDIDDGAEVGPLLDQVPGSVTSFTADGAYDQEGVAATVAERHPEAAIIVPPRSSAVPSEAAETAPTQRDRTLQSIAAHGRAAWQNPSVPMMMRHRPPGSLALRVLKDDLAHAHDPDPDRR